MHKLVFWLTNNRTMEARPLAELLASLVVKDVTITVNQVVLLNIQLDPGVTGTKLFIRKEKVVYLKIYVSFNGCYQLLHEYTVCLSKVGQCSVSFFFFLVAVTFENYYFAVLYLSMASALCSELVSTSVGRLKKGLRQPRRLMSISQFHLSLLLSRQLHCPAPTSISTVCGATQSPVPARSLSCSPTAEAR